MRLTTLVTILPLLTPLIAASCTSSSLLNCARCACEIQGCINMGNGWTDCKCKQNCMSKFNPICRDVWCAGCFDFPSSCPSKRGLPEGGYSGEGKWSAKGGHGHARGFAV